MMDNYTDAYLGIYEFYEYDLIYNNAYNNVTVEYLDKLGPENKSLKHLIKNNAVVHWVYNMVKLPLDRLYFQRINMCSFEKGYPPKRYLMLKHYKVTEAVLEEIVKQTVGDYRIIVN